MIDRERGQAAAARPLAATNTEFRVQAIQGLASNTVDHNPNENLISRSQRLVQEAIVTQNRGISIEVSIK